MIWKIIIVLGAAIASYFVPTPLELQNAFVSGQNFYASGNFVKAIEQYDKIIGTESPFLSEDSVKVSLFNGELTVRVITAALYQKANALKNLEKKDSSIAIFKIVEESGDEPELAALSQFQIYDIYYRTNDYKNAIIEAEKLATKYPSHRKAESALYDIGWAYKELDDLDNSSRFFQILIDRYSETEYLARAMYQLGQNNYDQKHYDVAIKHFGELNVKFKPDAFKDKDWENVQLKAVKERQIFEATAGRETDESTLELVAKAQLKIGDSYREKDMYDSAMFNFKKVITTYSLLPALVEVAYVKMASYTLTEKGIDEAIAIYKSAIDENFANKELQAKMQFLIAETYQNKELYDKAASEYLFYIDAYSDVAENIDFGPDKAQYTVVAMYYNARDYKAVAKEADTLLNNYPSSDAIPGGLFIKGLAENELGLYTNARASFERLINNYPNSPDFVTARIQIGFTYFKEAKYEDALAVYSDIIEKKYEDLDSSLIYFELMNVYNELKRFDEALACFDKVNFGTPYYTAALGKAIKIYGQRSEYDKGIALLNEVKEKAEKVDSVYYTADINFTFADLYISKNEYNTAVEYLGKVIQDSVLPAERSILKIQSQYARGVLNYQIENFQDAVKDLEFVLEDDQFKTTLSGYVRNANEKLALAYSKTGKKDKAIEMVNELLTSAKDEKEKGSYNALISEIYFEAGDYRKAIEWGRNVLKAEGLVDETYINSYITISNSYKELNDLANSASVLLEASEKYPNSPEIPLVLYSLGALYFDTQEFDKSANIFGKFITTYPEHVNVKEARYFRAYAYYELGNWAQASTAFRQYVAAYPGEDAAIESQYYAAEALFNAKEYNNAINEYRKVYQRHPNSDYAPMAMYNEGWCYFELQSPDKMVEVFNRLASRYPKSSFAGDALFTIGDYYYNIKDYVKSSEAYTNLIEKFPNYEKIDEAKSLVYDLSQINSYLEYEKAMKLFDARNYQKAIEELTKLYEKYPDASIAVGCQVNIAASYEMLEDFREAARWYKRIIENYSDSKDDNERSAVFFAKEHLEWIESNY